MNDLVKIYDLIGNVQQLHVHNSQSPELLDSPMQDLLPTDNLVADSEEVLDQLDPTSNICYIPPLNAIDQH